MTGLSKEPPTIREARQDNILCLPQGYTTDPEVFSRKGAIAFNISVLVKQNTGGEYIGEGAEGPLPLGKGGL